MDATINENSGSTAWYTAGVKEAASAAMCANPGIGYEKVAPSDSSGIKVVIVGAGFAGLACAIECKRKGHTVLVLEKFRKLKILGMLLIARLTWYRV